MTDDCIPIARPHGRRKWKRYVVIVLLLLLVVLWWRVWQGGVKLGPAQAKLNKIESNDSFSSASSTSSHGDHPHLAARRIVIVPRSDHPLLNRVVPLVRDALAALPFVEEVTALKPGEHLPQGGLLPDLLIEIGLPQIDESSSLYDRTLTATVNTRMTSGVAHDSNGYTDDLTPPMIDLEWGGSLEHHSTSIGDGIGSDRYQLTAPHIAEQIGKALTKELKDLNEKNGPLPPLPAAFYGKFRPADDLNAVPQMQQPPKYSGSALLLRNESVWEFSDAREPRVIFDEIAKALTPAGWKKSDSSPTPGSAYLRLSNGSRMLNISNWRNGVMLGQMSVPTTSPAAPYVIHYLDRFSRDEVRAALQTVEMNSNAELLLSFASLLSPEMREQLIAQLENSPATFDSSFYLAEYYQMKDAEKAKLHLRHAAALLALMTDESSHRSRIDDLAKKLKMPGGWHDVLTPQLLGELKIPQLTATTPLSRTVALNEPVIAAVADEKGKAALISLRIVGGGKSKKAYEVAHVIADGSGKSWGQQGGNVDAAGRFTAHGETGFNNARATWDMKETADGRFDVALKLPPTP